MNGAIHQDLPRRSEKAVAHYWQTRAVQLERQEKSGKADQGMRSAVTRWFPDGWIY